jgi:hypothetical protein
MGKRKDSREDKSDMPFHIGVAKLGWNGILPPARIKNIPPQLPHSNAFALNSSPNLIVHEN